VDQPRRKYPHLLCRSILWTTSLVAVAGLALLAGCGEDSAPGGSRPGPTDGEAPDGGGDLAVDGAVDGGAASAPTSPAGGPSRCSPAQCAIDGQCWDDEVVHPDDPCRRCLVAVDPAGWSTREGDPCDDANPCTEQSTCLEGRCVGLPKACDDGEWCTLDRCEPGTGACLHDPREGECDDGDPCTLGDLCEAGRCLPGPGALPCDDGEACTQEQCEPGVGCVSTPLGGACDDADPCTVGDACHEGRCLPGEAALACDDEDVCTDNRCVPGQGCVHEFNTAPCSDGSECTTDATCREGECVGVPVHCDDGNDCTTDTCNRVRGCVSTPFVSASCRPEIVVDTPARAATVLGVGEPTVVVTGSVRSGGGPIVSFTINGVEVPVDPESGQFSHSHAGLVGGNTLVLEAVDAIGAARRRVQAYHWSTAYAQPDPLDPERGWVDPGLGLWLGQETLDDGEHTPPPDDLATLLEGLLGQFDLGALIPDPALTNQAIWGFGVYSVFVEDLTTSPNEVALAAVDGGLHVQLTVPDVRANLRVSKTGCGSGFLEPCWGGAEYPGTLSITRIVLEADLLLAVSPAHILTVVPANPRVTLINLNLDLGGTLGALVDLLLGVFVPQLQASLQAEFLAALEEELAPRLAEALAGLALAFPVDLPRLDGATDPDTGEPASVPVLLQSDFAAVDATAGEGIAFALRARATTPQRAVPTGAPFDDNRGVPGRVGCGRRPQTLVVPGVAPLEVVLADDTLNQVLHAAWLGGLLEFPVGPELLGDVDLSAYGISDLVLLVSAWLPPLASDCGPDEELSLHAGDLRVDASCDFYGQPIDLVVFASLRAGLELATAEGEVGVTVTGLQELELQVDVQQEALISLEPTLRELLRCQLGPALEGLLGGGEPLFSFALPAIDLSETLGLPPGEGVIDLELLDDPAWPTRREGNSVIYGRFNE